MKSSSMLWCGLVLAAPAQAAQPGAAVPGWTDIDFRAGDQHLDIRIERDASGKVHLTRRPH